MKDKITNKDELPDYLKNSIERYIENNKYISDEIMIDDLIEFLVNETWFYPCRRNYYDKDLDSKLSDLTLSKDTINSLIYLEDRRKI